MPNRNLLFVALATAVTLTACHKSHSNLSQSKIQVAWYDDSTQIETPTSSNVVKYAWGKPGDAVLQVNKLTGVLRDSNGVAASIGRLSAEAIFANGVAGASAGSLLLNGAPLTWNSYHYCSYNNDVVWNDTGTNQWQVVGGNGFPAANVSMDGSFPEFAGVLPDSISPLSYSFTFNSSNTSNADSAKLFFYAAQNPQFPDVVFFRGAAVDATNGIADLNPYPVAQFVNYHFDVQHKRYYGGLLILVLMKETQQMVNGKMFTLARQRIIYKNVVIK